MIKVIAHELSKNEFGLEVRGVPEPLLAYKALMDRLLLSFKDQNSFEIINFTPNENRQTCSLQLRVLDSQLDLFKALIKSLESDGLLI